MKFGGSSVANAETIEKVVKIIGRSAAEDRCIVVLSAFHGTTDALIDTGRLAESGDDGFIERINEIEKNHNEVMLGLFPEYIPAPLDEFVESTIAELESICEGVLRIRELSKKTLERILSFGEIVSSKIISEKLRDTGIDNLWKDARELIVTDSSYGHAGVDLESTYARIREFLVSSESRVIVVPGFIARDAAGSTTTLGRGGSDYTGAIFAAAADAEILEIWTDVSGMMSADPRFVRNVRQIPNINYREAMELSHFGAKVIYPPTIQPVMAKRIPVWIKNTFAPEDPGTLIEAETADAGSIVRGISSIDQIAVLSLEGSGMVGIPGFSKRLFEALSRAQINVILITQSSSEHSICVAIDDRYAKQAKYVVDQEFENEITVGKIDPLGVETGFSILALVGDNMKAHTGVSGRMFATLGHNGINIHAIAQGSSERNISAIIDSVDVRKAVNSLHEEFFSDGTKQINLFIAGVGTVGKRLLDQIGSQHRYIADDLRLNLRVIGIANSKQGLFADEGIDVSDFVSQLADAPQMTIAEFTDRIPKLNLRNSIFVDVTASPAVVETYPKLLERSISIIACNKIAASSEYDEYIHLKDLAREFNANFLFETNVGAGLPVINTLNDLTRSGDRVMRIEAVLSGTLNFVFNNYDGSRKFAEIVRQAQNEGYTEPDPRLDLSGTDVARKILILARESKNVLEMGDIENRSFLPAACLDGTVDDFYRELELNESHFLSLIESARSHGKKLKYIATLDAGKASVGLEEIGSEHNFANLSGKDNAVLFYTKRYSEQPLVIRGAGAGADVTAAGVFADIIRASRS